MSVAWVISLGGGVPNRRCKTALLVYEHTIVAPDDLSRVNLAFFTLNGLVSLVLGGVTVVDAVIEVIPEDATVAFDDDNPVAVPVASPGGNSEPFSLTIYVTETEPDTTLDPAGTPVPGDIGRANVTVTLLPVGPGSPLSPVSCASSVAPIGYAGQGRVVDLVRGIRCRVVVGIAVGSGVGHHERGVALAPKSEVITPADTRYPFHHGNGLYGEVRVSLKGRNRLP